jgi:hypothetical protein
LVLYTAAILSVGIGVQPILINSSLVSAQCRKRLCWTNIPRVGIPEDKKICFQDIITNGFVDREKSHAFLTNQLLLHYCSQKGLDIYLKRKWVQLSNFGRRYKNQKESDHAEDSTNSENSACRPSSA